VAGSLPAALKNLPPAADVGLALPFYDVIELERKELKSVASFTDTHQSCPLLAEIFQSTLKSVPLNFPMTACDTL